MSRATTGFEAAGQVSLTGNVRKLADEKLEVIQQIAELRAKHAKINRELLAEGSATAHWVVACW
jgi:hypothetical protein